MAEKQEKLSKEQIEVLTEVFNDFDKNGDGEITSRELGLVLKALGMGLTETELRDLINEVDVDGNGTIDKEEFLTMMARKMKEATDIKEGGEGFLRETFHIFDKDGNGAITVAELYLVMRNLGEKISQSDAQRMMKWADKDGDGRITFQEFKSLVNTLGDTKGTKK